MKILKKVVISGIVAICLMMSQVVLVDIAFAQVKNTNTGTVGPASTSGPDTCAELKKKFDSAGGSNIVGTIPQYCTVGSLYTKFINFALYAIGIVAIIAVIYGGYIYMTARGNAEQAKKGRSVLTWAIIGLIVVLAAAVIVNVVVRALVENRFV